MADLGAFFGNPNIQRQGARARALASQRDVNTLPDPLTYAVMQGLLGTRPDEMGFSVLNPDYEKIKKVAEPAFALGLLGQIAPMGKALNAPAAAIGKAVAPTVDRLVPQILERGGLPAEMVKAMGTNTRSLLDVYHGSPHGPFNKFDPSKARTGEGNASYGEGAYLAEARGTGEAYRKQLSDFDISVDGKPFNADDISHLAAMSVAQAGDNKAKALNTLKEAVKDLKSRNVKWADELANEKQKEIDYLSKAKEVPKYEEASKGFLYKVDLPDEAIPKMLDWDKPLSQQTPEVRQALEKLGYQVDKQKVSEFDDALLNALVNDGTIDLPKQPLDLSGQSIYNKLKSQGLMASDELQKQGITGIRYLDEGSRGVTPKWVVNIPEFGGYDFPSLNEAKKFIKNNPQYKTELIEPQINTSNFVVFPKYQDLLRIKEINDKPITSLLE